MMELFLEGFQKQLHHYLIPNNCWRKSEASDLNSLGISSALSSEPSSKLNHNAAFIQMPIGLESKFNGIVDLIDEQAVYNANEDGSELRAEEIPKELRSEASDLRQQLLGIK